MIWFAKQFNTARRFKEIVVKPGKDGVRGVAGGNEDVRKKKGAVCASSM